MARLQQYYRDSVVPQLREQFGYRNIMEVPRLIKITLNMGLGEASRNIKILENEATDNLRDRERLFALRNEAFAKLQYAGVIARAVEGIGADELRMRSVVTGLDDGALAGIIGVDVIGPVEEGFEIETDRYRQFTNLAERIASDGGNFVEIAGNDDILFTALSDQATHPEALFSFARQGYGDHRHLFVVPVNSLAERLRSMGDLRLEHIHDY